MLTISWRTFPNVDGDVQDRATDDPNQFSLSERRFLEVETAHRSFGGRDGLIVLDKSNVRNFLAKMTITPSFREVPSRIGKPLWHDDF